MLYTHEHADHINGIDDLRIFSVRQRRALPDLRAARDARAPARLVQLHLRRRGPAVRGHLEARLWSCTRSSPGGTVDVAGVEVLPLAFQHGHLRVFGYRFGRLAYITDVKAIPEAERAQLQGLDVLVLNALWWRPHPTHLSIAEAIDTAQALGARRTYLTHLTHETGHAALAAELPAGILPAYDGLTVEIA